MKFVVSSSALLKQLSAINGVITTNPVVPILENFLCDLQNGTLRVTASDLQTTVTTELDVDTQDKGSIAVPASHFARHPQKSAGAASHLQHRRVNLYYRNSVGERSLPPVGRKRY